jgi:multiple sugar transport system substrate-binding protein
VRSKLLVVSLALPGLIATACSNDGESPDGVQISFQVAGEAEEISAYRTVEKAFEKKHPDIDVELIEIADKDEHLQKLSTSFAGGAPPDVFLLNFREYSQFVVRDALEPVGPHLGDAGIDMTDYFLEPAEAFTFDGELQCMPQNVSSLVVYYNVALFEAAGLERPKEGWSWEQFRDYAVALNDPDADVRGLGIEPSIIRVAPFVWSNGGEIVDDPHAPTQFTLDTPEAREAIGFLAALVREDGVVPTEEELAAQDLETRFATGKLGMLLSSRRDTPFFRENTSLNFDVASLPIAEQPVGILHSDAYCVARAGDELDAVMEFIGFAMGEEGQTITALSGRTVPSLRTVAESGAFLNPAQPPAHPEVFLDAIPVLRRTPVIPTWPEIEDIAEEIFTRIFYEEGYSIDDGLTEFEEATRDLFEEGTSF